MARIPDIAETDAERQPVDTLAGFLKQKCPTQEAAVQSRLQFTHGVTICYICADERVDELRMKDVRD